MKKHILIIEFSKPIGNMAQSVLISYGYKVTWVETFDEALQVIKIDKHFDAIVVDGCLNENSNFDTAPLIQKLVTDKVAPIIIAASGSPDICRDMVGFGCTHSLNGSKEKIRQTLAMLVPLL
jgi:DNA-binding response OmpR family regulator